MGFFVIRRITKKLTEHPNLFGCENGFFCYFSNNKKIDGFIFQILSFVGTLNDERLFESFIQFYR